MPLRLRINTQLITDDVDGWESMEENFFYQEDIFSYLHEITGDFVLTGSNYHFIRNLLENDICSEITVSIEDDACGQYQKIYEGVIYLTDVKWNLSECEASISISDAGLVGLIDDNKSVPMNLYVPTLKNGGGWNPPAIETSIGFVNKDSTIATAQPRRGMFIFDALQRIVELISDGQISVRSDYFDRSTGNPNEVQKMHVLMTGREIRTGDASSSITLKYKELLGDVNRLFNIAVGFEYDQQLDQAFLRIEPKSYFFQEGNEYTYQGVNDVKQEADENLFYAVMRFGSYESTDQFDYVEKVPFLSMDDQEYHLGGQCNIDNTLDLRTEKLIYDSNVIQRVLPVAVDGLADDSYDEEIFIVNIFEPTPPNPFTYYATATQLPYNTANIYFNASLSPYQVSLRWFGNIPFSIFSWLGGTGSQDASAYNPVPQNTFITGIYPPALGDQYQWIDFPVDISDPSGNWNHSPIPNPAGYAGNISHYQSAAGGMYEAEISFCWDYGYWQYLQFLVLDGAGAIQYFIQPYNVYEQYNPLNPYGGGIIGIQPLYQENVCVNLSVIIPMPAGSRLVALLPYSMGRISNAEISVKSTFSGEFQKYDFSTTKYLITKFSHPVHLADRNQILASPYVRQRLTYNGGQANGFLSKMKRNLLDGETQIEWKGSF